MQIITSARSENLFGPYGVAPNNPILTSTNNPENPLQKSGHGDIVETLEGEAYLVHLCGRPSPDQTLRIPLEEDSLSLTQRKGYLRLFGRESLHSKYHQQAYYQMKIVIREMECGGLLVHL